MLVLDRRRQLRPASEIATIMPGLVSGVPIARGGAFVYQCHCMNFRICPASAGPFFGWCYRRLSRRPGAIRPLVRARGAPIIEFVFTPSERPCALRDEYAVGSAQLSRVDRCEPG